MHPSVGTLVSHPGSLEAKPRDVRRALCTSLSCSHSSAFCLRRRREEWHAGDGRVYRSESFRGRRVTKHRLKFLFLVEDDFKSQGLRTSSVFVIDALMKAVELVNDVADLMVVEKLKNGVILQSHPK